MKTSHVVRTARIGSSLVLSACGVLLAQPTGSSPLTAPPNGPKSADPTWHALVDATVHVKPGVTLEHATVVFRGGVIESVQASPGPRGEGAAVPPPAPPGARAWDCAGLHVYAGFIDPYVEVDAPPPDPKSPGVHWNAKVTPQRSALDGTGVDERTAEALRKLGFAAAGIAPRGGVFRGTGAVVSLARPASESGVDLPPTYLKRAYHAVGLSSGGGFGGGGGYPGSQMGVIAVIRQTLIDASWQAAARRAGRVIAPNAIDPLSEPLPILFDTGDELESLRAGKVAREFSRPAIILGSGMEFRRLDAIRADNLPLVVPLNFPRAPDVASIGKAEGVELRDLMTWEQAPTNPRRLEAAGLTVALTTHRLRDRGQFSDNLRKAIRHGLAPDAALAMLTTRPAAMLGVSDRLGTVEPGRIASLVVADGDLFSPAGPAPSPADAGDAASTDEKRADNDKRDDRRTAKVRDVWIDGARHEINAAPIKDAVGVWTLIEADGQPVDPDAPGTPRLHIDDRNAISIKAGDKTARAANVRVETGRVSYTFDDAAFGNTGIVLQQAAIDADEMLGVSIMPDGSVHRWKARRTAAQPPAEAERPAGSGRPRLAGTYRIATIDDRPAPPEAGTIEITRDNAVRLSAPGVSATDVTIEGGSVEYAVDMGGAGVARVKATLRGDTLAGTRTDADGTEHRWTARREPADKTPEEKEREAIAAIPEKFGYPFGPYALDAYPRPERVAILNATVWTCGPAGVTEDGAVVIADGTIAYVGPMASLPRLDGSHRVIDAKGRHVTPGIIDCHSHTGISGGVNEGTQACTAEVRIEDVTNPDAINWYRQLAGGVTTVNSLHGSANPIGGQNCVNKIRWGAVHPDDMHFAGAKPGIKFALGENVKQSNWDAAERTRYPQTRMGVESIIRDRFVAAREYAAARAADTSEQPSPAHANGSSVLPSSAPVPVRRDLELEALAEILAGQRLVHCHSYRQDEILMLARLAHEFGFRIGTYQHNLEGYKVADAVRDSALGASLFSDWWNYKVEVQDAIPQAGPIMWEVGNVVSYNSDSDELARRLNVEAGKAVKYGGLRPEEALKFVTINPAIQLAIDSRVGSLEAGKDADLAIWSGPPLSSLSRCEATFVDGRELFSLDQDRQHRDRIASERRRLIQKLLADAGAPGPQPRPDGAGPPGGRRRPVEDPREDYYRARLREHSLDMIRRGIDPESHRCGDCGMGVLEAMGER